MIAFSAQTKEPILKHGSQEDRRHDDVDDNHSGVSSGGSDDGNSDGDGRNGDDKSRRSGGRNGAILDGVVFMVYAKREELHSS